MASPQIITEAQADAVAELERRLIGFYNTTTDYPAFAASSGHSVLWQQVIAAAREVLGRKPECRILEVGAGRSGFGGFLKAQALPGVRLISQDITQTNVAFLKADSDEVVTENIDRLSGSWDVIFHSYVYEHLCRPAQFLSTLWKALEPGGYLIIQSPRYDFPFYLPPSLGHLSRLHRGAVALRLVLGDLASLFSRRGQFLLFADPAVFHLPFHRDRDAIHRVRRTDLVRRLGNEAVVRDFALPSGGLKDWLVKRFLTLRVTARKKLPGTR